MKNVWKGMFVGAIVGAMLDAAGAVGKQGHSLADTAVAKVREADLLDKVRDITGVA